MISMCVPVGMDGCGAGYFPGLWVVAMLPLWFSFFLLAVMAYLLAAGNAQTGYAHTPRCRSCLWRRQILENKRGG